jgi:hypothetical protein
METLPEKLQVPNPKLQRSSKLQTSNGPRTRSVWSLEFGASLELGAWDLELRALLRALLPRIGLRDNDADRVLIEALETAFTLEVFKMTANSAFATK